MTIVDSLILAVIQAVTEFLPVSSDGHLNLVQIILKQNPSLNFDIFLNTATLLSVLLYFWGQRREFIKQLPLIFIGSMPAGVLGILYKDSIDDLTNLPSLLPFFFLYTALLVFATKFIKIHDKKLNWKIALVVGIFQSLAILPGVSRSASTIFSGLLMGLSPSTAFSFSFFLFIPASFGALLLSLKDSGFVDLLNPTLLPAFILTSVLGYFVLNKLQQIINKNYFWLFSIYTFTLSLILFIYYWLF